MINALGTIAYALVATLGIGAVLSALTRWRFPAFLSWPLSLAFCWGIELWQLTPTPGELSRQWIGWRLALGTSFDWFDVAMYPIGVALGTAMLWWVRRSLTRHRTRRRPKLATFAWPFTARASLAAFSAAAMLVGVLALGEWLGPGALLDAVYGVAGPAYSHRVAAASWQLAAALVVSLLLWLLSREPRPLPHLMRRYRTTFLVASAVSGLLIVFLGYGLFGLFFGVVPLFLGLIQWVALTYILVPRHPPRAAWARAGAVSAATALLGVLTIYFFIRFNAADSPWLQNLWYVCIGLSPVLAWLAGVAAIRGIPSGPRGPVPDGAGPSSAVSAPLGAGEGAAPDARWWGGATWLGWGLALPLIATVALLGHASMADARHWRAYSVVETGTLDLVDNNGYELGLTDEDGRWPWWTGVDPATGR